MFRSKKNFLNLTKIYIFSYGYYGKKLNVNQTRKLFLYYYSKEFH